ncbi:hypothetical protein [Rhizobacter sp. SG703]|uniref:hypothetical protein n=1 Tax=Rhizobacter sp. SG703 TaxID=2587140 RepID=UPI0014450C10|nr:hypothetical protein [Rhizobacter sp. SG703]NKI96282.1 hypothetical protein [Rhizobacter sp. SG703]
MNLGSHRFALSVLAVLALAACGGSPSSQNAAPVATVPTTQLSGSVAVGAPITGGTLRILDADGVLVAHDIAVGADGSFTVPTLTGKAPFRIEACGYAGANYQCLYSVAQGPGTAQVTPLTSATVLLAAGQSPADLMAGSSSVLDASAVAGAQAQLRAGLSGVLSGNVAGDFDFITGALSAGSRSGYDKVLDAVGVTTGVDDKAFVQITPRLGSGNLYLEQGSTVGAVTVANGAGELSLGGLETLFANMTQAMASAGACSSGLASQLASGARMSTDDGAPLSGAGAVAAGLCGMFASQDMFGSRLLSPTLGRCDLDGAQPVCRVSFVLQDRDGGVQPVGSGMGVTREGGAWKFLGDVDPVQLHASAKAQRDVRIDGDTPVASYSRAIAFDIQAVSGLQCAQVVQRNADQALVTIAYYKRFGAGVPRLSLWQQNGFSNERSLDPAIGALRSADDTWVALPDGDAGDVVVRNFFRGGRTVTVNTFSDDACSAPFAVSGRSSFEVDVEGVPPVWAAMPSLPWTDLTGTGRQALLDLALDANAGTTLNLAWTFAHGTLGLDSGSICSDRSQCGQGGSGRIADFRLRPGATSAAIAVANGGSALAATGYKMLALYGRTGDGLDLQSNAIACTPGTVECH